MFGHVESGRAHLRYARIGGTAAFAAVSALLLGCPPSPDARSKVAAPANAPAAPQAQQQLPSGHPPIGGAQGAPAAQPAMPAAAAGPAGAPDTGLVTAEVVETLNAGTYTYIHFKQGGTDGWAAVPQANVAVGSTVRIRVSTVMTDFKSPSLNRTFAAIIFGTLDGPSPVPAPAAPAAMPAGHPAPAPANK